MSGGVSASPPPPSSLYSRIPSKTQITNHCCNLSWTSSAASIPRSPRAGLLPSLSLRCNSSATPGGPGPGENENRSVLDAFFLGKALAEALNERIESTVGEFLSTIGRLQAEQQKQVQDFQEDVLERAKRAKEKAAREAMEVQGFIPKSSTANISTVTNGVASSTADEPATSPAPPNSSVLTADKDQNTTNTDPLIEKSNDD